VDVRNGNERFGGNKVIEMLDVSGDWIEKVKNLK